MERIGKNTEVHYYKMRGLLQKEKSNETYTALLQTNQNTILATDLSTAHE